ncbi:MAG TPA: gliding motility-associated C-terminal domain-containing protein [Saprospiraceae bacterium]|nr:gliding motility-associated C-terminal domain-containing protein [Saprospiraceae bacterium]HMQ83117.1 gliding motility-associated C-terminal domain-containing protein [Saprospiraceae bacterium]
MKWKLIIVFLLSFQFSYTVGQELLSNPSFEGSSQVGSPPDPWVNCGIKSSVDTQPDSWGVESAPSDGLTYIGLSARTEVDGSVEKEEAVGQSLSQPILPGQYYQLRFDLMHTDEVSDGLGNYSAALGIEVWLGKAGCEQTTFLGQTPLIEHSDWRSYSFDFWAEDNYTYILFKAYVPNTQQLLFGYVFMDNATLITDDTLDYTGNVDCPVFVPNAFSPNDDGRNDRFHIYYNCGLLDTQLSVYDRWGGLVFEGDGVQEGWDGTIKGKVAPEGVYVWLLRSKNRLTQTEQVQEGALNLVR